MTSIYLYIQDDQNSWKAIPAGLPLHRTQTLLTRTRMTSSIVYACKTHRLRLPSALCFNASIANFTMPSARCQGRTCRLHKHDQLEAVD
uniref:AlNc14C349G10900 protein n=1 Tax=Albugo laibachii Nc14 TaxID=890382 RepID=F0WXE9_9STRA|nr:AlNc14C349G10900 [Albugo laibachii Nc14]|eukprot:CCA26141.1 AlNc14C349G10900 [Albugo laibachii Nc14]